MTRTVIKLEGDASGHIRATTQAGAATDQLTKKTTQAGAAAKRDLTPAINASRSAFAALGTQLVGIPGPLGQVAAQFGTFAVGGVATVAILGGLAAIAFAFEKLTAGAREAKKDLDALMASDPSGGLGLVGDFDQINAGYERIAKLREEMKALWRGDEARANEIAQIEAKIAGILKKHADLREKAREQGEGEARATATIATSFAEAGRAAAKAAQEVEEMMAAVMTKFDATGQRYQHTIGISDDERAAIGDRTAGAAAAAERARMLPFGTSLSASTAAPNMAALAQGDAGPGPIGSAFAGLAEGARTAGDILKGSFGPASLAMSAIFEVMRGVLQPLQPILDVFSSLLQSVGVVLGTVLAPVLRVVATVFSYVIQGVGLFIEALGKLIDKLIPDFISKAGQGIRDAGQKMQDDAKAARDSMKGAGEGAAELGEATEKAAGQVSSATSGLPAWFKIEAYRFRTASPGALGGSTGGGGGAAPVTINASMTVVQQPGEDGVALAQRVEQGFKTMWSAGRTTHLDVRFAPAV